MASSTREHRAPVRYGLKPDEIREIASSLQARGNTITDSDIRGLSKRFGCAAKTIHEIAERLGCTIRATEAPEAPAAPANAAVRPRLGLAAPEKAPAAPRARPMIDAPAAEAHEPPVARAAPAASAAAPPAMVAPAPACRPHRLTHDMVDDWLLEMTDPRDSLKFEVRGSSVLEDPRDPVRRAAPAEAGGPPPAPNRAAPRSAVPAPRTSARSSLSDNSQIASALGELRSRMSS